MHIKNKGLWLSLLAAALACTVESGGKDAGGPEGGKADNAAPCDLDDDAERELVQFVNAEHVQFRCLGPTGFVATSCCDAEIADITAASECPLQVKWNDASGSARRCVEDDADSDGGRFVPTACCAPLCPDEVEFRDQDNGTFCVDDSGTFQNAACCILEDDAVCAAAAFDAELDVTGTRRCRDTSTGRFAPAACCVDDCFDTIAEDGVAPAACLAAVEEECANAFVNAGELCADAVTGKFVKAACCDALPDDRRGISDELFECQEIVDIFDACPPDDECPEFLVIEDTTAEDDCCDLFRQEGFTSLPEFC